MKQPVLFRTNNISDTNVSDIATKVLIKNNQYKSHAICYTALLGPHFIVRWQGLRVLCVCPYVLSTPATWNSFICSKVWAPLSLGLLRHFIRYFNTRISKCYNYRICIFGIHFFIFPFILFLSWRHKFFVSLRLY